MKNIYFLLSASLLIASCGPTTVIQSDSYEPAPAAPVEEVSYQSFYDQLSPYGNWINYPGYGYVWMPNAGPDFQPYATNGNWIYTNAGWTWASNYNWGWAPFHYGRWFYENGYGWMWVPGNEWAPAWVSWRGGGDYYGWAPLGPRVTVDMALSNYNPPNFYWNFVPRQYMGNPNWHNYYVGGNRNVTIINNTTIINNYSGTDRNRYAYAPGPDPNEVRRYSGNNFKPVQIRQASSPGERMSGQQYNIYQPRVTSAPATRGGNGSRPASAPARYESFYNVRPSAQYPSYNQPSNNQPANTVPVTNNPRPAVSNPANNQPPYNAPVTNSPRPAGSNPNAAQPPVNTRPAVENPAYNQPTSTNPRPSGTNPVNNPSNSPSNNPVNNPVNNPANPRPAPQRFDPPPYQKPVNTPANEQPVNSPQPANTRPSGQKQTFNAPPNQRPANTTRTTEQNPVRTQQAPVENTNHARPQPTPAASRQQSAPAAARPAPVHNPNSGNPVQRSAPTESRSKPTNDPADQPKTRSASGGN